MLAGQDLHNPLFKVPFSLHLDSETKVPFVFIFYTRFFVNVNVFLVRGCYSKELFLDII